MGDPRLPLLPTAGEGDCRPSDLGRKVRIIIHDIDRLFCSSNFKFISAKGNFALCESVRCPEFVGLRLVCPLQPLGRLAPFDRLRERSALWAWSGMFGELL
ncbi:MAG TPA: hypothetical protein DCP32_12505 [Anaerolineaceae bacterium]|nr:hypothetical protein [Anaerolineaceae bacterium]